MISRKRILGLLLALPAGLMLIPVQAARRTVALMPVTVVKGAPGNGPMVTEAMRDDLTRHGRTVVSERRVTDAIETAGLDTRRILTANSLMKLRRQMGVDFVIYTRILAAGVGLASGKSQSTVLVNIYGGGKVQPMHTVQVTQKMPDYKDAEDGKVVMGKSDAAALSSRLLKNFYAK